jgi:cytochrome c-type biogenesis protein CcmE
MNPTRRRRLWMVALIVAGAAVATALTLAALNQNLQHFFSPSDVHAGMAPKDHTFRLGGIVEEGSVRRASDSLKVEFTITDRFQTMPVHYEGILPDLVPRGQSVVTTGRDAARRLVRGARGAGQARRELHAQGGRGRDRPGQGEESGGGPVIPELGQVALILALLTARASSCCRWSGAARNDQRLIALARPAAYGQSAFVVLAFGLLALAFVQQDFSVAYVAQNSNLRLPPHYRFTAVWGAHEGSLLLWALILGSGPRRWRASRATCPSASWRARSR